jgi:protein-S-isoprenylcysteine O-methyltransferase Ste14
MTTHISGHTPAPLTPNAAALKTLAGFLAALTLTAVLLFGGAGRLDWGLGWLFVAAWLIPKLAFLVVWRWRDPDLLVERATRHPNTQSYDRAILPVYFALAFSTFLVAGLDGGRFGWSAAVPVPVVAAAYFVYLLGNGLAGWAMASNPYHSSESRLQAERGQTVVDRGPYQIVRHPSYLAAVLLWPATGPMLGSWWAVIPGVLTALMMIIRTICEDRMLQAELPGYADYARQVRYRLIPGLW